MNNTYLQKPNGNSSMLVKHIQVTLHSKNSGGKQNKLRIGPRKYQTKDLKSAYRKQTPGYIQDKQNAKSDCYQTEELRNISQRKKQSQKIQKQTRDPKERNSCKRKPSPERQNGIVRTNAGKTPLKGSGQHSQAPVIRPGILESLVRLKYSRNG